MIVTSQPCLTFSQGKALHTARFEAFKFVDSMPNRIAGDLYREHLRIVFGQCPPCAIKVTVTKHLIILQASLYPEPFSPMSGRPNERTLVGTFTPTITIFQDTPGQEIDVEANQRHILYLARSGIQGALILGSTGEQIAITREERKQVCRVDVFPECIIRP